ncbi:MAG: hypothetical protein Q7J07_07935 [Pelolinea sp.]|nr:hypothetical protein [Pelolinea sp.]
MKKGMQSQNTRINNFLLWMLIASIVWISVALLYSISGIDWLENTDSTQYFGVVNDLRAFEPAIQPLYPAIVRGLTELFPQIEPAMIGQFVSFVSYIVAVAFMHKLFQLLNVKKTVEMTLIWAMFPFVGVTMSVYPRANALLLLFTVLCFWSYVKNNTLIFIITVSLLPLIHKSSLFFLIFLIPIAFFEKKIKWWMVLLTGFPTLLYIFLGILEHDTFLRYFQPHKGITPVTSLLLGDGLLGTIILGIRGSIPDMIQGMIVISYFIFAIYLLLSKIWKGQLFILSAILPVIILGLVLPAREIWSLINYTSFFVISISLLDWHDENYLGKKKFKWVYIFLISCAYFSQFAYALYDLRFYGLI